MSASCGEQGVCSSHKKGRGLNYDCSHNVDVEVRESTMMKLKWMSFVSAVIIAQIGVADQAKERADLAGLLGEAGISWGDFLSNKNLFGDLNKENSEKKKEEEEKREFIDDVEQAKDRYDTFKTFNQLLHAKDYQKAKATQDRLHSTLDASSWLKGYQPPPLDESRFSMPNAKPACQVNFGGVLSPFEELASDLAPYAAKQFEGPLREEMKEAPKRLKEVVVKWFKAMDRIRRTDKEVDRDWDKISNPALSLAQVRAEHDRLLPEIDSSAEAELKELGKNIDGAFDDFDNENNETRLVGKISPSIARSAKLYLKYIKKSAVDSANALKMKCEENVAKAQDALTKWTGVEMLARSSAAASAGIQVPPLSTETHGANTHFKNELNDQCKDISADISNLFTGAEQARGRITGSADFPSFANNFKNFLGSVASGVNGVMNVVDNSQLVQTCEKAAFASKKWCAHIAQAGLSCTGDGSSQPQAPAVAAGGLSNQQPSASTAAPNGVAGNPLLLHSVLQGLGGRR